MHLRRVCGLSAALALGVSSHATAQQQEAFVAAFEIAETGARVEAVAWRADGRIWIDAATARALDLKADGARIALDDASGVTIEERAAEGLIRLWCTAACYPARALDTPDTPSPAESRRSRGGFLNLETVFQSSGADGRADALVEAVGFTGGALFESSARFGETSARLETRLVFENEAWGWRTVLGDALTRAGPTAGPVRFAGLAWGDAFDMRPDFITFPTPTLSGEAAAPATLDLYVNDLFRARVETPPGPFTITDTPIVAGAGLARLVVRDALGREQEITRPFYASPAMLRAGLAERALAIGSLREDFAGAADRYGATFVSMLYRRGLDDWLTLEAQGDAGDDGAGIGLGASLAHPRFGQVDLNGAASARAAEEGASIGASWSYVAPDLALTALYQRTEGQFLRLGRVGRDPLERAAGSVSWRGAKRGGFAISAVSARDPDRTQTRTLAFSFTAPPWRGASAAFSLLWAEARDSQFLAGVAVTRALRGDAIGAATLDYENGSARASFEAQRTAPASGGYGYRARLGAGATTIQEGALSVRGARGKAEAAFSRRDGQTGLRAHYAFSLAHVDGARAVSRPIRGAFAILDVDAPNVAVSHDGRAVGSTDSHGRLLIADLRPYETNRIAIDLDSAPLEATIPQTETSVRPGRREGAHVRLAVLEHGAGEVRVTLANGEPPPLGAILVRRGDGARFPIGTNGRAFLVASHAETIFEGGGCVLRLTAMDLRAGGTLRCAEAGA